MVRTTKPSRYTVQPPDVCTSETITDGGAFRRFVLALKNVKRIYSAKQV